MSLMAPSEARSVPTHALTLPHRADAGWVLLAITAISLSGPLVAAAAVPGTAMAFWRCALAVAVLVPLAAVRDRRELGLVLRGRDRSTVLAGVLLAIHFATWLPALGMTSVASATAMVCTQPVWGAIAGHLVGERLPRRAWLGVGLAVVGVSVIAGIDLASSTRELTGDVLALSGGLAAALYTRAGAAARRTVSTTGFTAGCYGLAALLLLPVCLASGAPLLGYASRDWFLVLAVTAGPQLLGHSVINHLARTTSPTVLSLLNLFHVPGAVLVALVWLGQVPGPGLLPGLALLLGGAAMVVSASTRAESLPAD